MALSYVCPKCDGTDVYFAKKLIITGLGGIYGNRQKEVERPFCRKCDIEAKVSGRDTEGIKKFWVLYARISIGVAVVMLMLWLWASGIFS
jgi:hypothetical protein